MIINCRYRKRSNAGTRGNIYDKNGKLLAYNELAYSVTIEDNYGDSRQNKELNKKITKIIKIVRVLGDSIIHDSIFAR